MKNFLLGTILGAATGVIFSCLKDSDGNRPGKPLKVEAEAFKHEGSQFAAAVKKAKKASQELSSTLPDAERAINDINNDVENYSRHIQPIVNNLHEQGSKLSQDIDQKKNN